MRLLVLSSYKHNIIDWLIDWPIDWLNIGSLTDRLALSYWFLDLNLFYNVDLFPNINKSLFRHVKLTSSFAVVNKNLPNNFQSNIVSYTGQVRTTPPSMFVNGKIIPVNVGLTRIVNADLDWHLVSLVILQCQIQATENPYQPVLYKYRTLKIFLRQNTSVDIQTCDCQF